MGVDTCLTLANVIQLTIVMVPAQAAEGKKHFGYRISYTIWLQKIL